MTETEQLQKCFRKLLDELLAAEDKLALVKRRIRRYEKQNLRSFVRGSVLKRIELWGVNNRERDELSYKIMTLNHRLRAFVRHYR